VLRLKLLFISLFIAFNQLKAKDSLVVYTDDSKLINISPYLYIYEDVSGTLKLNDIIKKDFKLTKSEVPNFGISESLFWIKIRINNQSKEEHLLLSVMLPTLDNIGFYSPNDNGSYSSLLEGEQFPFYQRKYIDSDYLFDVNIPKDSIKTFYLKISSKEGIQLPIVLGTEGEIYTQIKNRDVLSGIYFGIMIALILYNFFIFLSVKDKNYIYYVIYIILILITQTILQGYPFQYLWPNYPVFAQKSLFIFPSLVSIAGLEFIRLFLQLKIRSKPLFIISYIFYLPYLTSIFLAFIGLYKISFHMMELSSMSVSIYMLITAILILRKGFQPAKYFLAAWSAFLIGICIYVLKDLEILPFNNFTRYTMQIGSAIETILLSFALANRINILKREKEQSQTEMLLALKENEKLITEQNIVLEQKVEGRTIELKEANQNLSTTLSNLRETQTQLINAEKMASLGQLTAGIAHEINNPINFISGSLKPLKMDILDLMNLVERYEKINKNSALDDILKEIEKYKSEIDLDYIKKEMEMLLAGIEDGTKRTQEIISGLKTFSRLDENEIKAANISEGIEATLLLLKHTIPKDVDVILELDKTAVIECLPGKLNQVFMNIINNSIFALSKKRTTETKKLVIKSYASNENVCISVEDTGIGMTPEVKNKMFDPFFTTKDVGEGTGLGMSIVYKILETHHAKIEVDTAYGKGTKITITLNKKLGVRP
jgi:signal transduction histidine kinase